MLLPGGGIHRVAAGEFKQAGLAGGQPGGTAGVEQKRAARVGQDLRAFIQSAASVFFSVRFQR